MGMGEKGLKRGSGRGRSSGFRDLKGPSSAILGRKAAGSVLAAYKAS